MIRSVFTTYGNHIKQARPLRAPLPTRWQTLANKPYSYTKQREEIEDVLEWLFSTVS